MRYRRLRVQDLLQEEISSIIQRDIKDPGLGFITILEVKMTEDLKTAKVVCSVYGEHEEKEKTMKALNRSKGYIKFLLGQRIKLRLMPEINFILDNSYEKIARIEEILKKEIHVPQD
ncbi:MAG: 30S ribosome-binding factor RbfA [Proteobacteria bacterium]|jgi:ribosome-binding factor A|nr:30S ribosome-binding factor RbfA [Pseudomonadota bacterium]